MSAWGAFIGLLVSIFLIIRKVSPVYSLILGALVGGLLGGVSLPETVSLMISGVNDVTPAVIRILTAGVLSGILVKTGAAASISNTIIYRLGERHVFFALAFATMLLTAIGVFIDVAVITVAPIALSIGRKLAVPRGSLLLMMIGGGKCGNIISPNPNTIIAAENFHADLYSVMYANLIPALVGLLFTVYVIGRFLHGRSGSDDPTAVVSPFIPCGDRSDDSLARWRNRWDSGDEEMVIDYGQPLVWTQEDVECLDPVGRDRHYSGSDQGFLYQGCFIRCVIAYEYGRAFIGSGFRRIDVCRYSLYYSRSDSCLFVIRGYYYRRRYQWCLGSRYD